MWLFVPIFILTYIYIYSRVLCFIFLCLFFYFLLLFFLHFPLSGPVLTYISLLIIPCMIVYVTNNKEPWTLKLLLCFYKLFGLSFWWHPFTAEDPLVSKLYKAKFLQICSDEEKKNLHLGLSEGESNLHNFLFWVNYSFKQLKTFFLLTLCQTEMELLHSLTHYDFTC